MRFKGARRGPYFRHVQSHPSVITLRLPSLGSTGSIKLTHCRTGSVLVCLTPEGAP